MRRRTRSAKPGRSRAAILPQGTDAGRRPADPAYRANFYKNRKFRDISGIRTFDSRNFPNYSGGLLLREQFPSSDLRHRHPHGAASDARRRSLNNPAGRHLREDGSNGPRAPGDRGLHLPRADSPHERKSQRSKGSRADGGGHFADRLPHATLVQRPRFRNADRFYLPRAGHRTNAGFNGPGILSQTGEGRILRAAPPHATRVQRPFREQVHRTNAGFNGPGTLTQTEDFSFRSQAGPPHEMQTPTAPKSARPTRPRCSAWRS